MGIHFGGGFAGGLALGARVGGQWANAYKQSSLEQGLGDAAQRNQVTEDVSASEAQDKTAEIEQAKNDAIQRAREEAIAKDASAADQSSTGSSVADQAGLAAGQQYDPSIAEAKRLGAQATPQFSVGKDSYATRATAQGAANAANTQGMADVYSRAGHPEAAQQLQGQALALKAAGREDAVGDRAQGLKLGQVDNQYALLKGDIQNQLASQKLTLLGAKEKAFNYLVDNADRNPAAVNQAMSDPDFKNLLGGIKDFSFIPGTQDGVAIDMGDNGSYSTTLSKLRKDGIQHFTVGEGAKFFSWNGKNGPATEIASNPRQIDPEKSFGARIGKGSSGLLSEITSGKGMMESLDSKQRETINSAMTAYRNAMTEYNTKYGRPPSESEEAQIMTAVKQNYGFIPK